MGVRAAGVLRLGGRRFEPRQLLVMAVAFPAADGGQTSSATDGGQTSSAADGGQTSMDPDPAVAMEWVHSAVAEGADIVEVPGVPSVAPFVATVRDAYPELVIGVRTGRGEVAREACAAGADLLFGLLSDGLLSDGLLSDGLLFEVAAEFGVGVVGSLAGAARAVEAGVESERVIVEGSRRVADLVASGWPVLVSLSDSDLAGDLARAAVFGWLGARVFRVRRVRETRRALNMVSAIRGDVPPAYAVRGLA
jgi:dihydropteroate synthase